ncbi:MAG: CTP synthase [Parcubacteria group bacterium]|nr:CTP synthase [Parcubacteria group bacterium]
MQKPQKKTGDPGPKLNHKYIFVIGGVMSGVGKGVAVSAIGKILQARGFAVNALKIDPYLNVDAGTMNPTEHGEVFVLKSGLECDQDMGNYERFLGKDLGGESYMTSGMVYKAVIDRERNLGYRGRCVEAIPHIRDEIVRRIRKSTDSNDAEVSVIEIGGTVGDYQNIMFIDAARVLKLANPDDVLFVMVSFLPVPSKLGEMKTKPTQNAIRQLNSYGVQPDIIIARSVAPLDKKRKEKIAISCNIGAEKVISAPDVESIYDVPLNFEKDNIGDIILKELKLLPRQKKTDFALWKRFVEKTKTDGKPLKIAIVGKYFDTGDFMLSDAYISVIESLKYSAYHVGRKPEISWLSAVEYEKNPRAVQELRKFDGVLIPGGFGERGVEGKIRAIAYAREKKIPYFGLCYGMQLMVVEYARHALGLKDAHTTEVAPETPYPVIDILPEQKKLLLRGDYGGTMRLGAYLAILKKGTAARKAYGKELIEERHRHRYEVNPEYVKEFAKGALVFSGHSPDGKLMEIAELPTAEHPFFLGTQFHPEFQARPLHPHPLFTAFLKAACLGRHQKNQKNQKKLFRHGKK